MQRVSAERERERERVSAERSGASERGHAAGRLRARCGSNAQQSCVPATAPRTHVMKQQSDGDAMKKSMKNGSKINPKSINNETKIDQKSPEIEVWRRLGDVLEASRGFLGRLGSIFGVSWEI